MVKLASVRECRLYGPTRLRNRWEYINAGLHVFCCFLLLGGLGARLAWGSVGGLYVLLVAVGLIAAVNVHDIAAHVAGLDFWMVMDTQLLVVEIGAPLLHLLWTVLAFMAILFLLIAKNHKLEEHALNLLIAGPVLWLVGSIQNACQAYESADAQIEVLQKGVYLPFIMGSEFWLVAGVLNRHASDLSAHGPNLLGRTWACLGISGSALYFIGGLVNLFKVFIIQQLDGPRLEGLRTPPQESSEIRARIIGGPSLESLRRTPKERPEIMAPLIGEGQRRVNLGEESTTLPTSYKDALVGQA